MRNIKLKIMFLITIINFSQLTYGQSVLKDSRDQKTYKTVKIGTQIWMAENLNYNTTGSSCYENSDSNCDKYGRLYSWKSALQSCPSGWHLPTLDEVNTLVNSLSSSYENYSKTNGFNGLLSGWKYDSGFYGLNFGADYWTSTEASTANAWKLSIRKSTNYLSVYYGYKIFEFSIRCVQDK